MIKSYPKQKSSYLCTVKQNNMNMNYQEKVQALRQRHEALLQRKNQVVEGGNGIYEKYVYPILTAEHTPLEWKYDFNEKDNPFLMQRIMMNAVLNAGAIKLDGRYLLVCRVEGADRKSFFAVAESPNGIDQSPRILLLTSTICVSPSMRTAGSMVCSVQSVMTPRSLVT